MLIRIKTTVNIPEVPSEVAMGTGTLRDVFKKVFGNTHSAKEIIDPRTGEISLDSLFDVRLCHDRKHIEREGSPIYTHLG
jgi:hypothetical protein